MSVTPHLSVILLLCLLVFTPPTEGKRSFGVQRRQKSGKSFSARRGGGNSSPDNSPIPAPVPPKPAPQPSITKTNAHNTQSAPAPGWNNSPQGPPPAYPGLGHNAVPKGGAPPPYSPSYANPPPYSAGAAPYGGMGGGMGAPMGGAMPMGAMPMGGSPYGAGYNGMSAPMYAPAPQKSGSGFSVGSLLMGMAAGHAVSSVVGGLSGGRRQYSETHIHHHYDNSKEENDGNAAHNEGLAPLVTSEPVLLATAEQGQIEGSPQEAQAPPVDTIYSFNYAPGYTISPQPGDSTSSTTSEANESDTSAEATTISTTTTEDP